MGEGVPLLRSLMRPMRGSLAQEPRASRCSIILHSAPRSATPAQLQWPTTGGGAALLRSSMRPTRGSLAQEPWASRCSVILHLAPRSPRVAWGWPGRGCPEVRRMVVLVVGEPVAERAPSHQGRIDQPTHGQKGEGVTGYTEVIDRFFQMTGIELSKLQLKNKWDKLKNDLTTWDKLMKRQTGTGWDNAKGVSVMDNEWWKKARADISGCDKFSKKRLQNEDQLQNCFGDITNDESNHWNPMSSNPIIPPTQETPIGIENYIGGGDDEVHDLTGDKFADFGGGEDEVEEISPSIMNAKRRPWVVLDKSKKQKTGTSLVIQEQVTRIANSASSYTSKKQYEVTVQLVLDLVVTCGAGYETD